MVLTASMGILTMLLSYFRVKMLLYQLLLLSAKKCFLDIDIWQNQYNIVKLKNLKKIKKINYRICLLVYRNWALEYILICFRNADFFFLFQIIIFFNWRIIALQCCVIFCHKTT